MKHNLLAALLAVLALGCGQPATDGGAEQGRDETVANEAHMELSEVELADLRQRAEGGDTQSINALVNYYWINFGSTNEDAIYWQIQAARLGDCEQWRDLMFMEIDEGHSVPARFFSDGETLISIGEGSDCPPYTPRVVPAQ